MARDTGMSACPCRSMSAARWLAICAVVDRRARLAERCSCERSLRIAGWAHVRLAAWSSCAAERAGLGYVRAHRLRHTAATELLRAGASLPEVGQVLRHRRLISTAIYAKVDERALRQLARPWPVEGSWT